MMTTFHVVHIIVGLWLALVNVTDMLTDTTLAWNNFILGLIVAGYNVYYLFARKNVDVQS
jgi:heme/copper-type cytochrome/quinol oxidase subunit 3